tara:strand:- start:188 stop:310 length:123 start_codon:yes stop_codon:yes gene_type:complete
MQKIIFITISLLIFGLIIYIGVTAIIRGKKSKESKKKTDE